MSLLSVTLETHRFCTVAPCTDCCRMCEEVATVLGLDWVLLFLQSGLHSTTVVWGLRILVAVCSVQSILQKFKEGTSNGGWLRHTDHNKMALALGT